MPFDPALPANGAEIVAAELRSQFTGLKSLLDSQSATISTLQNALVSAQNDIGSLQSTVALLQSALNDTARNPASLSPFTAFFSDPMTASDGNTMQANLNALLAAVQRV